MTYVCFIESEILPVPQMQPLDAGTPEQAALEARRLLAQQVGGIAAHIFAGEERVYSVRVEELTA